MTERNQVNDAVRRYLSVFGRIVRVENSVGPGTPDIYYLLRGVSGWLEDKIIPTSGACPLTLEQVMWGEAEYHAGGRWWCLGLRAKDRCWRLYDVTGARAWYEKRRDEPAMIATGAFPTKELLRCLAQR